MKKLTLLDVPSDIIAEIFSFFKIKDGIKFRWQIRWDKPVRNRVQTWFRLMLVCKTFLKIGRRVFDPSIKVGLAFRIACTRGYVIDLDVYNY